MLWGKIARALIGSWNTELLPILKIPLIPSRFHYRQVYCRAQKNSTPIKSEVCNNFTGKALLPSTHHRKYNKNASDQSHYCPKGTIPILACTQMDDYWSWQNPSQKVKGHKASAPTTHQPLAAESRRIGDLHGNLHGGGDKPLRFKVPPIKTKFISSPEHWNTST